MRLSLAIASWYQTEWVNCVRTWHHPFLLIPYRNIIDAYQYALEKLITSEVIGYVHDDLWCLDRKWKQKVLDEFDDPQVALVGFAGAPGYGHIHMYDQPYDHMSMGRIGFRSNLKNAEIHGARFTGSCNVVALDGLAFFVRSSVLASLGGWPMNTPVDYFMYMEWLCFSMLRIGKKIRMVGVACDHLGGRSTGLNPNLNPDFQAEHRFIYEHFRDVLPARVEP